MERENAQVEKENRVITGEQPGEIKEKGVAHEKAEKPDTPAPPTPPPAQESPLPESDYPEPVSPAYSDEILSTTGPDEEPEEDDSSGSAEDVKRPRLTGRSPGKKSRKSPALQNPEEEQKSFTGEEKLLLLDVWEKSGLGAHDFSSLVNINAYTLYAWRKKFDEGGPEGLFPHARGPEPGSKVDAATRRAILMLKKASPDYGCQRISDILYRGPGLGVSPTTVSRVLKEEGYVDQSAQSEPHPDKPRSFERAKPMQLWQSDLFCFVLKRQGQRVHMVAFMDDHSRFITGFGLASRASAEFVIEVVRSAIGAYGPPEEMLTDRGPQYNTWRGKGLFGKEMDKRGIKHILSRPRHPQTLGKVERFWGSLWRECVETAVFMDLEDARRRIGFFADFYNFQRPHQSLDGLVPADRFFSAGSEVRKTLEARVAANALDLAKNGPPRKTFYLTGRVGDVDLSLHTEGEKVVMTTGDGKREEVDLRLTGKRDEGDGEIPEPVSAQGVAWGPEPAPLPAEPGASRLDEGLEKLRDAGLAAKDAADEGEVQ
ncbi:MAG: DDE-type integrase/transposase/recombinase [Planctomycetota bacterium]